VTKRLAGKIGDLVDYRSQGAPLPEDLAKWSAELPPRIRNRLAAIGLLSEGARPMEEHLTAFETYLRSRGNTAKHVSNTLYRIRTVFTQAKVKTWSDVRPGRISTIVSSLKRGGNSLSPRTKNYFLRDLKSFARWCVRDARIPSSPIEHLRPLDAAKIRADRRYERRPLTVEETRLLLQKTATAGEHHGMTGKARSILYRLAIESGLRAAELRSLSKSSFDFAAHTVTVESGYTKNKEKAVLPLRQETAELLKSHLASSLPTSPAFPGMPETLTAEMVRADLQIAGIEHMDASGKLIDFHSLRGTCASFLAAVGTHPKIMQKVLRHSSITLTLDLYTTVYAVDVKKAIGLLPTFTEEPADEAATGTDGEPEKPGAP